jgi:Histidine kinase-, DNA gyrase B-, and HSP90-like ATPase
VVAPPPEPVSRFWTEALAARGDGDDNRQARDALRASMAQVRRDSDELANQIAADLPEFTVHDGRHLDALWPLIDQVTSADLELTPTEVWTLGVAIVLHDLGLAVAAYPGGREELRASSEWPDARVAALRAEQLRAGKPNETLDDHELDLRADATVLRKRHAQHAEELVNTTWNDEYLVVDPTLRKALGPNAGRIASSHWWSTEELSLLPDFVGAPAGMPPGWTVRPILLAVLLRIADAAHLDAARAPRMARAVRQLSEESRRHWDFQERMNQPVPRGDQLRFSSGESFPVEQAEAWWLCFDSLRLLDSELTAADSLLQAKGLPRLRARSVEGARDPLELARFIRPEGWEPVDARIEVSNVMRLVERLGGRTLYSEGGEDAVPLRELLQNASDAVRARRALQPGFEGSVEVWVSADLDEITVRDDGVGMDADVLTGALLDFGRSLWESEELASVHPGLQAAGFEPTGKFGIGFFSVFMWADRVEVVSRARYLGEDGTHVLVFPDGLDRRPLLRRAEPDERLMEPGTFVRLRVREGEQKGLRKLLGVESKLGPTPYGPDPLTERLALGLRRLAPAFEVDLSAALGDDEPQAVLAGGDWKSMNPDDLMERLYPDRVDEDVAGAFERATLLGSADGPSGRIAFTVRYGQPSHCVLVAGGLRVGTAGELVGLLSVDQFSAARFDGRIAASPEEIAAWATDQANIGETAMRPCLELAARVLSLGGDSGPTPLAECRDGGLTRDMIVSWVGDRQRVLLIDVDGELESIEEAHFEEVRAEREWKEDFGDEDEDRPLFPEGVGYTLASDVLHISESGFTRFSGSFSFGYEAASGFEGPSSISSFDEVLRLAAIAWGCDVDQIDVLELNSRDDLIELEDFGSISTSATEFVRPA